MRLRPLTSAARLEQMESVRFCKLPPRGEAGLLALLSPGLLSSLFSLLSSLLQQRIFLKIDDLIRPAGADAAQTSGTYRSSSLPVVVMAESVCASVPE